MNKGTRGFVFGTGGFACTFGGADVVFLNQTHKFVDFNNIPYSLVIQLDFLYNKEYRHHPNMTTILEQENNAENEPEE